MKVINHKELKRRIFEWGDIIFVDTCENFPKPYVGYVFEIGVVGVTDYVTDNYRIVREEDKPTLATPSQIEIYRNDLIPMVEGISYVTIRHRNGATGHVIVPELSYPIDTFRTICDSKNIPYDKDSTSAGGGEYYFTIELHHN